jgi:hypothetical protein
LDQPEQTGAVCSWCIQQQFVFHIDVIFLGRFQLHIICPSYDDDLLLLLLLLLVLQIHIFNDFVIVGFQLADVVPLFVSKQLIHNLVFFDELIY